MSIKNFNRIYFISNLAFFLINFSLKNDGVLFISFHVIFLRILDSLNNFAISFVIRIRRSAGFPRAPTACIDQISIKTRDLFPCHKPQANIFYNGLVYCRRSEKCKKWTKIRVLGSIWPFHSRLGKVHVYFHVYGCKVQGLCSKKMYRLHILAKSSFFASVKF